MNHLLKVNHVEHFYGKKKTLSKVNFICNTSDIIGIFGRNGSGKSTLLKILFGTVVPHKIDLYFDNNRIDKTSPKHNTIGYLPQEPFLPKDLKVRSIIPMYFAEGEKQNKIFYAPMINRIENQKIGSLSLGEQRYLEFLLIINLDHNFILLDEPFSMIEPLYKDAIKENIIKHKTSKGFIITDHYYFDVMDVANKKYVMKEGVCHEIENLNDLMEFGYLSSALSKKSK